MPRFVAGGLTTAGSTTLPIAALVGDGTRKPHIYEIGVFNTTATPVALKLVRMTTAGTPGATLTSAPVDEPDSSAVSTALLKNTYSVTATMTDLGFRCQLGAAIGSGFVFTFGADALPVPAAANAAVGIVVENGTGQACQVYYAWWE
jgi:hypothetical protein